MSETLSTTSPSTPSPRTPLADRIINIFVTPAEVLDEVARSESTPANWLVPVLLSCLAGIISFFILAEWPPVSRQPGEFKQIAAVLHWGGALPNPTEAHLDGALAVIRLNGFLTIVAFGFGGTFWTAFVIWAIGRVFLKCQFSYHKSLEVAGLAQMILALATITTTLLILATGNFDAKPALSLFLRDEDARSKIHLALAALNLFHVWLAAVLAAGLAKLGRVTFSESAFWVAGYWLLLRIGLILLGGS